MKYFAETLYTKEELLTHADHTLLDPAATWEQIRVIVDDAIRYHTASICIPPAYVKPAYEYLQGKTPVRICTVIGFPNGYNTTAVKVYETAQAVAEGADEIDMVIHPGMVKAGRYDQVLDEIRQIKRACDGRILKVIIETCLLTEEEKKEMCRVVTEAGADYIKTSTGFSTGGATFADVKLMAAHVGPDVKIKAAGGISSFADAAYFTYLGADRLGTSRLVKIVKGEQSHETY
ncbi:MAG: deoxyribose-phosphate aldolase [Lachnospiraceae bacterium]|nr:deoxyribose-phosphate aldolase [Lachnospiraceae bacterium]